MFFTQEQVLVPIGKVGSGWKNSSAERNSFSWIFILKYECSDMQKSIKVQCKGSRREKKRAVDSMYLVKLTDLYSQFGTSHSHSNLAKSAHVLGTERGQRWGILSLGTRTTYIFKTTFEVQEKVVAYYLKKNTKLCPWFNLWLYFAEEIRVLLSIQYHVVLLKNEVTNLTTNTITLS